ncbi:MAG: hypothetical protein II312_02845 [Lachnospiraceae bacterium]|nr:hypothetical protein [Lachnospiraceae bacterium]MBQ2451475.1 hypothetical protein [Lachnospiraceae bacterium]MEE0918451.1 hypothetical protein [Lachnospiraceae bacterium]
MDKRKTTKSTLMIRVLLAVYLLYLAYGLIKDYSTSNYQILVTMGIAVFGICGIAIFMSSVIRLVRGRYDDVNETQ